VTTRTIWLLRAALEGVSYILVVGAIGPLGTQHPTWFLIGGAVKIFLSSLLQQAGNDAVPTPTTSLSLTQPAVKSTAA
jgi:hypothetical protein